MSARLEVDPLRFAYAGEETSGEVPIAELGRLVDGLVSDAGEVRYRLQGGTEQGRPVLRLAVDATLTLRCQYCMEPYRQEVRTEQVLPLARDSAELERWEQEDPLLDALVAESPLDVLTLVEDEILLSLPLAPRHPGGNCGGADA